ncbi:MAG: winged helix-turn-helix domain-containing protein [Paracoccaceae bacterium]
MNTSNNFALERNVQRIPSVFVDPDCRTITQGKITVRPTRAEFDIIYYLSARPGFVRSRAQIMDAMGAGEEASDRAIDTHVKRIRAYGIRALKTSRGVGYYWEG